MGRQERFRKSCATVALKTYYRSQDALATGLRAELKLPDNTDLRPVVTRYLNGDIANPGFAEVVHVIFMRSVVRRDYPAHFLSWFDRALGSYDLCASEEALGKRDGLHVRALLAEARLNFEHTDEQASAAFPRYEAARRLMLGVTVAVEQRVLQTGLERIKEGIEHLKISIGLFGKPKTDAGGISGSDKFHMAHAQHMIDWLLSELPDAEAQRKDTLCAMRDMGALSAYEWLASTNGDWQHQYNVAEIRGELSAPNSGIQNSESIKSAVKALYDAIALNPRLADFDAVTHSDGVDEPLSQAPALRHVLPVIRREHAAWLEERVAVYRRHASKYEDDPGKEIRAMLKDLKKPVPVLAVLAGALLALSAYSFLFDVAAAAKPIF
jgi:hypothetical protein